jgi:hypothetical protein
MTSQPENTGRVQRHGSFRFTTADNHPRGNITEDYAKEMAKSLCTQLHGTLNPAYLKCDDYNHHDVQCACKEVYDETLSTHDGTLEKYLACKIYEFIEKI